VDVGIDDGESDDVNVGVDDGMSDVDGAMLTVGSYEGSIDFDSVLCCAYALPTVKRIVVLRKQKIIIFFFMLLLSSLLLLLYRISP